MTEPPPYVARIQRLRGLFGGRAGIDALVVTDIVNIAYMSGFTGSLAMAVIGADDALLITDGRYVAQASQQCPDYRIVPATGLDPYNDALISAIEGLGAGLRLGFESSQVTVAALTEWRRITRGADVKWVAAPGLIESLRRIKDEGEIAAIREAVRIAESAFAAVSERIVPGVRESELAIELEFAMRRIGADAASFDTIVASGPNGAFPHHRPGPRLLRGGDLVTIDWGARKDGYCSDITRTVAVPGGVVDPVLRRIHAIVLDAKERAGEACVAGAHGADVDAVARGIIAEAGYGEQFKHGLGHGLGREVHDGPTLSRRADATTLCAGMVTTVEPGIYIDGLGGVRIEEDILIAESGPVVLTSPSKTL